MPRISLDSVMHGEIRVIMLQFVTVIHITELNLIWIQGHRKTDL